MVEKTKIMLQALTDITLGAITVSVVLILMFVLLGAFAYLLALAV